MRRNTENDERWVQRILNEGRSQTAGPSRRSAVEDASQTNKLAANWWERNNDNEWWRREDVERPRSGTCRWRSSNSEGRQWVTKKGGAVGMKKRGGRLIGRRVQGTVGERRTGKRMVGKTRKRGMKKIED